jgi:hypothetical protein
VQDSVRHLVGQLGYDIEELPRSRETTTCCGFGGLMVYANRDLAKKVVARRIAESPADYVTYCAVCRDYFAAQGKPTRHLLDLIFGSATNGGRGPGFSQKHENRARLKRQMLQERWGETVTGQEEYANIQLNLSDAVLALMEERLILAEDVQQVIAYAERTGQKLLSPATGHFLAQFRPNTVTYWVEYAAGRQTATRCLMPTVIAWTWGRENGREHQTRSIRRRQLGLRPLPGGAGDEKSGRFLSGQQLSGRHACLPPMRPNLRAGGAGAGQDGRGGEDVGG